jgi:hypothetical protein
MGQGRIDERHLASFESEAYAMSNNRLDHLTLIVDIGCRLVLCWMTKVRLAWFMPSRQRIKEPPTTTHVHSQVHVLRGEHGHPATVSLCSTIRYLPHRLSQLEKSRRLQAAMVTQRTESGVLKSATGVIQGV